MIEHFFNNSLMIFFLIIWGAVSFAKLVSRNSPEIKDAAKAAAVKKTLGLIGRWLS
ncbi:MAG: hypothetical protein SGI88_03530 [Candidatus Hydrogenedentes bacterium]|nr:hypothetical protein [Candidatus Hydrogenedentota bacterium]